MMVMEEMQETYSAAGLYREIFLEALQQLAPSYDRNESNTQPEGTEMPLEDDVVVDGSTMSNRFNGGLMDALMDEASIFNVLDSFNMI